MTMKNYNIDSANNTGEYFLAPQDTFFLQRVIDEIYRATPLIEFKRLFSEIVKESKKKSTNQPWTTSKHSVYI